MAGELVKHAKEAMVVSDQAARPYSIVTYEYKEKAAAEETYSTTVPTNAGEYTVKATIAATTNYKKGDKVKFSVVFDELISDYSNVTVDTSKFSTYMPINNVTCTGGKGTNILTFEGTATKDFENGTFSNGSGTNNELMDIKPVNGGTIKDIKGNNRAS